MESQAATIALCYLVRAADSGFKAALHQFAESYSRHSTGADHRLYVIFKGFDDGAALNDARAALSAVGHTAIFVSDDGFDVAAYAAAARQVTEQGICFLNTHSEILCERWLAKLAAALGQNGVGAVGATGSFESMQSDKLPVGTFPAFPNAHLRSNAFMIGRELFCAITEGGVFERKLDAYLFESGPHSMMRRICERGLQVLVVGRNGRGYTPRWWPSSETFRRGVQANLLVADNQTRAYEVLPWDEKRKLSEQTWGAYIREDSPPARI